MEQWRTPRGRKIYTFLRKDPKAAKVRAFNEDREPWLVLVTTPKEVCAAVIDADRLEALDASGTTLRVLDISEDEPDQATPRSSDLLAVDVPRLIDNIGRNMRELVAESSKMQSQAYKSGFDAMTDVVKLCIDMLQRVDQRLEEAELREPQVVVQQDEAPAGADERNELAKLAIMRALGQGGPPPPGPVNHQQVAQLQQLFEQYLASQISGAHKQPPPEPNGHAG